jgi:siroheme synthase-like protein
MRKKRKYAIYPAMLRIEGLPCTVVGGGVIATRKAQKLLQAGAKVTVITKIVSDTLAEMAAQEDVQIIERSWQKGDGENAWLVIAATNDRETNHQIAMEARQYRQWVNVVDDPDLCTFMVPAVVDDPDFVLAISTKGSHPRLAKKLKQCLIEEFKSKDSALATWFQQIHSQE